MQRLYEGKLTPGANVQACVAQSTRFMKATLMWHCVRGPRRQVTAPPLPGESSGEGGDLSRQNGDWVGTLRMPEHLSTGTGSKLSRG